MRPIGTEHNLKESPQFPSHPAPHKKPLRQVVIATGKEIMISRAVEGLYCTRTTVAECLLFPSSELAPPLPLECVPPEQKGRATLACVWVGGGRQFGRLGRKLGTLWVSVITKPYAKTARVVQFFRCEIVLSAKYLTKSVLPLSSYLFILHAPYSRGGGGWSVFLNF